MRLRNSTARLKRLQLKLSRARHPEGDSYRRAKIAEFWEMVRLDKRIVEREQ